MYDSLKTFITNFLLANPTGLLMNVMFANLILSVICGTVIFFVFFITYKQISVSAGFSYTLILLPPISCMLATIISNDLALTVGMVGSLSIIRFRLSLRETKNLAFIFWSVTVGIACGLSFRLIAVVSCLIISASAIAIHYFSARKRFGTLVVRTSGGTARIENVLDEFSLSYDVKYKNTDKTSDILYEISHKKGMGEMIDESICDKIMRIKGVLSVKLIKM